MKKVEIFPEEPRRAFPLQDYAAIGDGRSIALIAPNGSVGWWCVPSSDSEPWFDCLLDAEAGGYFSLQPTSPFEVTRRYRPDSNVLETTFVTAEGSMRVTESMNYGVSGLLPACELARRVEVLSGTLTIRVRMVFGTRGDTVSPWLEQNPNGCIFHVGSVLGLVCSSENLSILEQHDRMISLEGTLAAGERALVAVIVGENEPLGVPRVGEIDRRIDLSDTLWKAWAGELPCEGPYGEAIRRSALILKLLLFVPSGAIAAAATTSLPERIGGHKNWDYRFTWVRDATYSLSAFLRLSQVSEAQKTLMWLVHRLGETGAKVCYRIDGGEVPTVRKLDLPGYRDSRPVVVGNDAVNQHQHGIYGDIFLAVANFVAEGNVIDQHTAFVLSELADECADRWRLKDAGFWELEEPQHYTISKVSCWQALMLAVKLAEENHLPSTCQARWARERDRIADWVNEHCWSAKRKAYTFYAGTERLDAALTGAVCFGFNNRERLSSTCDAIKAELSHGPWLYRYSDVAKEEGAFLACTFWLVEAYVALGRRDEAVLLMDTALANLPPGAGVLSEMVDANTGDLVGNTPQGLSHLALIHAAMDLAGGGLYGASKWIESERSSMP